MVGWKKAGSCIFNALQAEHDTVSHNRSGQHTSPSIGYSVLTALVDNRWPYCSVFSKGGSITRYIIFVHTTMEHSNHTLATSRQRRFLFLFLSVPWVRTEKKQFSGCYRKYWKTQEVRSKKMDFFPQESRVFEQYVDDYEEQNICINDYLGVVKRDN